MITLIGLKNGVIFEVGISKKSIINDIENNIPVIKIAKLESEIILRRQDGSKFSIDEVDIYTESIAFLATKD